MATTSLSEQEIQQNYTDLLLSHLDDERAHYSFLRSRDAYFLKSPHYSNSFPLPKELMIKIFEYVVNLSDDVPEQLDVLGNVCESWRQLLLQTKSIWHRSRVILVSEGILRMPRIREFREAHARQPKVKVYTLDCHVIRQLIKLGVVYMYTNPFRRLKVVKVDCKKKRTQQFNLIMIQPTADLFEEPIIERGNIIETLKISDNVYGESPNHVDVLGSNLTVFQFKRNYHDPIDFVLLMKSTPNLIKLDYEGNLLIEPRILKYFYDNPEELGWKKLEYLSIKSSRKLDERVSFLSGCGNKLIDLHLHFPSTNDYNFLRTEKWRRRKIRSLSIDNFYALRSYSASTIEQWLDSLESLHLRGPQIDMHIEYLKALTKSPTNKTIKKVTLDLSYSSDSYPQITTLYEEVQSLCRKNASSST